MHDLRDDERHADDEGCCVTGRGTSCIYDGVDPTIAMLKQNNCQPPNGTWTKTPP